MPKEGITVTRTLRAKRELVFEAWTRPDLMARWFFPGEGWTAAVAADVRVGGRYEVAMRDKEGVRHVQFGEYREVVPASRLVFTWSCPDLKVEDSLVTLQLRDHADGTELSLRHELPPDPKIRRGHEEGWQGCLGNLEEMVSKQTKETR